MWLLTGRSANPGGVGFVFHATLNPFAGIDLDGCRDPRTGVLAPWAQSIVAAFGSYAEVSPSGTGVKIIVRGKPRHNGQKKGTDGIAVETYGTGRFFTTTGAAL
jgi:putative DNA primase/helicase